VVTAHIHAAGWSLLVAGIIMPKEAHKWAIVSTNRMPVVFAEIPVFDSLSASGRGEGGYKKTQKDLSVGTKRNTGVDNNETCTKNYF